MLQPLTELFLWIVDRAHDLTGNYWVAIFVFTLVSKVVLMPLSLWCQKNSIVMVQVMPDLFRLKEKYFGDRETVDEKQNELYKSHHYHPLLSLIPLALQILILFALVDVIHAITDSGAPGTEFLGLVPSKDGGSSFVMVILATLSAIAMGFASNHINPLQKEQSRAEKNMTNGLSIVLSMFLAFFVACGMAFYWVCSNLLSILVQVVCNIVIRPSKYIDYDELNATRDSYEAMVNATKSGLKWWRRDPNAGRERADYKRFFKIDNKHLVFYSEGSGFYKYFRGAIEWLLANSDIRIHYVTSDPNDQIFKIAETEPRILPYYLGQRRLITLMMKMDADVVVTSLGDLDNFYIKRSYVDKDTKYVYMCHHMTSMTVTSTRGEYTNYDAVMCVGPHQQKELRALENYYGTKEKDVPAIGYDLLDREIADYAAKDKAVHIRPEILIAPTWNYDNLLDSCIEDILSELLGHGYHITVRPHPEYKKRYGAKLDTLLERYHDVPNDELTFEMDFSGHTSILEADVLMTDWSSIAEEFSFTTLKPCLFIDTAMKELNHDWREITDWTPSDIALRNEIGISVDPKSLEGLRAAVDDMISNPDRWAKRIEAVRSQMIFNLGHGGEAAGEYLLREVLAQQGKKKKANGVSKKGAARHVAY